MHVVAILNQRMPIEKMFVTVNTSVEVRDSNLLKFTTTQL